MLLFKIFGDIFRNKESSGIAKAFWTLFVIVLPLLGTLIYLLVEGKDMAQRDLDTMAAMEDAQRSYIQKVAGGGGASAADELAKLGELKNQGVLTEEEFAAQKAKLLA